MTGTIWTQFGGKTIGVGPSPEGHPYSKLIKGRGFYTSATPGQLGLSNDGGRDISMVADAVGNLGTQVADLFIGRDELISVVMHALASGEHIFAYGPPGTAKTAVLERISEGITCNFWRILFRPDVELADMIGTFDPAQVRQGEWKRKLRGLARCDLALIDECWKGSDQAANMLLTAMNERLITNGDQDVRIPLQTALGASNEVPKDKATRAAYDRWLLRLGVANLDDPDDLRALSKSKADEAVISPVADMGDIRLMSAVANYVAAEMLPDDVIEANVSLVQDLRAAGWSVTNRRFKSAYRVAAASALLAGEDLEPRHMSVARWVYWDEPEDEGEIRKMVLASTDPVAGSVIELEAILEALAMATVNASGLNLTAQAEIIAKTRALRSEARDQAKGLNGGYKVRLETVANEAADLTEQLLDYMA